MKKINILVILVIMAFSLSACSSNQQKKSTSNTNTSSNSSSEQDYQKSIIGSYRDDDDGAAINLNYDHQGRYVFYDPENGNTDDNLTWKKIGTDKYQIELDDNNVSAPIIAKKMSGGRIQLTSEDPNWRTEILTKVMQTMDLDEFLNIKAQEHSGNSSVNSSEDKESDTPITEEQAKQLASRYSKYPASQLTAKKDGKTWEVKEPAGFIGRQMYYVYANGTVASRDIMPNE